MGSMNFDLLKVMTIKYNLWRILMPWCLVHVYWNFWEPFYLRGVVTFLPCLELNFNHTTAQKAVFLKLLTKSMAQGYPWKFEGPSVSQVFLCFYACTTMKFPKFTSGSNLELKETTLQHHTRILSFNIRFCWEPWLTSPRPWNNSVVFG